MSRKAVFPAAQWLSLPFDTPEGAWALGFRLRPVFISEPFGPVYTPVPLSGFSHLSIAACLQQCGRTGACAIAAAAAAAAPAWTKPQLQAPCLPAVRRIEAHPQSTLTLTPIKNLKSPSKTVKPHEKH